MTHIKGKVIVLINTHRLHTLEEMQKEENLCDPFSGICLQGCYC